jgi:hypothetical protein
VQDRQRRCLFTVRAGRVCEQGCIHHNKNIIFSEMDREPLQGMGKVF